MFFFPLNFYFYISLTYNVTTNICATLRGLRKSFGVLVCKYLHECATANVSNSVITLSFYKHREHNRAHARSY